MTRQTGELTPPQQAVPPRVAIEKCANCAHIRRQAEEAFSELRNQTDKHIAAVQRKLREDHAAEISKLKSANEALQAEIKRFAPRDSAVKTEVAKLQKEHQKRMKEQALEFQTQLEDVKAEFESRLEQAMKEAYSVKSQAKSEREEVAKQSKLREARDKELEAENERLALEIDRLEIELQSVKGQLGKVKHEHQLELERQLRSLATERDQARDQLTLAEQRIASLESGKRESDIEKARADLNYRRRMGEMESEIRRTEIESVRLRREIIQLNQKIETLDNELARGGQPALRSARNRIFALELPPANSNSGRIARIDRSPRNVEALTPTSN